MEKLEINNQILRGIVKDADIARIHGSANFGDMTPRQVINDGVIKTAVGYHCGHTQFTILREHKLITKPIGMSYDCNLTKKGKMYARALYRIQNLLSVAKNLPPPSPAHSPHHATPPHRRCP